MTHLATPRPVKVGVIGCGNISVIGCGNISSAYFSHAPMFPILNVIACADMNPDAAQAQAEKFRIPQVLTVDELLAQPNIEIILNLTIPQAHVPLTIYGTEGTLKVPDPNGFDGPVEVNTCDGFEDVPHSFLMEYDRKVGVADLAYAIRSGRALRAGAALAYNVLDAMQGFLDSSRTGQAYIPTLAFERPAPMPADLPFGILDE